MSLIRRTILLTLSLLVLMSSIGLTVGMHLCGGSLQDLALFHKAEACSMEQQQTLPCHGTTDTDKNLPDDMQDCCQDNLLVIEKGDDAVASKASTSLKAPELQLLAVLQVAFLFLSPEEKAVQPQYTVYSPPPLVRDIPVLVQSFLI